MGKHGLSLFMFLPEIFLKVENSVSHFVVLPNIVRTKNVHSPGVLPKRTCVEIGKRGLAAAACTKFQEETVDYVVHYSQNRNGDVVRQIKLHLQLIENPKTR